MREKISELMNEMDMEYLEQNDFEAYAMDDLELEAIHKNVVNRYKGREEKIVLTKKKRIKWNKVLLIAVIIALGSTTVWAFNKINLFDRLFVENEANLSSSGQILNLYAEQKNIRVTLKGIVGYDKKLAILYEIDKLDGIPFEGNELEILGYLQVKNGKEEAKYVLETYKKELVEEESTPTKRVYISYILNSSENKVFYRDEEGNGEVKDEGIVENFTAKEAKLVITDIVESYESQDEPDRDLLEVAQINGIQQTIPFDEEKYKIANYKETGNGEVPKLPTRMLPYKGINLKLYNRKPRWLIENIGWIDNQLHIRFYGQLEEGENSQKFSYNHQEAYSLNIVDEQGENRDIKTYANYNEENQLAFEKYVIYDIKDIETLKKCKVNAYIAYDIATTLANWEIPFQIDVQAKPITLKTNEEIILEDSLVQWEIDKIDLANVYMSIHLKSIDTKTKQYIDHTYEDRNNLNANIKLIFKDRSELNYDTLNYGNWDGENEDFVISLFFMKAIDISQVEYIVINGVVIKIQ